VLLSKQVNIDKIETDPRSLMIVCIYMLKY